MLLIHIIVKRYELLREMALYICKFFFFCFFCFFFFFFFEADVLVITVNKACRCVIQQLQ